MGSAEGSWRAGQAQDRCRAEAWIAKQQKYGRIGEEDPYRLAVLFLDMLIGEHQLSWPTGMPRAARRDKIDETVRPAVKLFLRGCAPLTGSRQLN
jgi:TetR/AcrR family transcriptional repressor of mexJK operon